MLYTNDVMAVNQVEISLNKKLISLYQIIGKRQPSTLAVNFTAVNFTADVLGDLYFDEAK